MSGIELSVVSTTSLRRTVNAGLGAAVLLLLLIGGVSYWSAAGRVARIAIVGGALLAIAVMIVAGVLFRRDVSARAHAEEELRRSRSFLDSIIEQLPHMVSIKDAADLRFVRFNRAGEELLGARGCRIGQPDQVRVPGQDEPRAAHAAELDHRVLGDAR